MRPRHDRITLLLMPFILLLAFCVRSTAKTRQPRGTRSRKRREGEVYLTASGAKHHTETYRFVAKLKILCTLADAKAKKY